jgi:hypothetical protein
MRQSHSFVSHHNHEDDDDQINCGDCTCVSHMNDVAGLTAACVVVAMRSLLQGPRKTGRRWSATRRVCTALEACRLTGRPAYTCVTLWSSVGDAAFCVLALRLPPGVSESAGWSDLLARIQRAVDGGGPLTVGGPGRMKFTTPTTPRIIECTDAAVAGFIMRYAAAYKENGAVSFFVFKTMGPMEEHPRTTRQPSPQ